MTVTKQDISKTISKKLGLSQKDSLFVTKHFYSFLIKNHKNDININNFGSFKYIHTPKRIGRNPKTKEVFPIKARKKIKFIPSDTVKKIIN